MRHHMPTRSAIRWLTFVHCTLGAFFVAVLASCNSSAATPLDTNAEIELDASKPELTAAQIAPKKNALPAEKVQPRGPELKIAVSEADQRRINLAIDRGVRYLKANLAKQSGQEDGSHSIGRLAIGALTLVECGMPADDPLIANAARAVRASSPRLRDTYSLSLAIMFLDRLDQPADRKVIRSFAARLVAGQNGRGGWTYDCPVLTQPEETILLTMLEDLPPLKKIVSNPTPLPNPLPLEGPLTNPLTKNGPLTNPLKPKDPLLNPLEKDPKLKKGIEPLPKLLDPLRKDDPKFKNPLKKESTSFNTAQSREMQLRPVLGPGGVQPLPPALRNVPALNIGPGGTFRMVERKEGDDNSNTQFAIMGLWAARRHGVPMDRTLVLVERRFRSSQNFDGSWGYHGWDHKQADSMTCTGLLGMALALGLDLQLAGRNAGVAAADPAVKKGFAYLASTIGKAPGANPPPKGKGKGKAPGKGKTGSLVGADARGDLYYLWSVERVAVSYGTPTIGTKSWYHWGAGVILAHQQADGSWRDRHSGIPDTSFALLFLARANLVRGLPRLALQP